MNRHPISATCAMLAIGIPSSAPAQQAPAEAPKETKVMETIIVPGTKVQNRASAESL